MNTIRVFIPGDPKAQPRPRRAGNRPGVYNPSTADAWKDQVKAAFFSYYDLMIEGPIICNVKILFPRPQRLMTKKSPDGEIPHIAKPDRDNLDKSILDCLSGKNKNGKGGIGVWKDDCQVYGGQVSKFYCAKDGVPGAWVEVIYED